MLASTLVSLTWAAGAINGKVDVSTSTINTESDYTFEMGITTSIPSGGRIEISFPVQGYTLTPGQTYTCTNDYGFTNGATCTVDTAGSAINLTGAFATSDFLLIFTL